MVEIPKSGTTPLQPRNVLDTSDNQEEEETYNRKEEVEFEPPEPKKPKILDNLIQERLNMHLEGSSTEPVSLDVKVSDKLLMDLMIDHCLDTFQRTAKGDLHVFIIFRSWIKHCERVNVVCRYLRATYGTKLTTQCKNGEMKLMRASGTER